jgi:hypothetical protein
MFNSLNELSNPKLFKDLDKGKIFKILSNIKNSSNWGGGGGGCKK